MVDVNNYKNWVLTNSLQNIYTNQQSYIYNKTHGSVITINNLFIPCIKQYDIKYILELHHILLQQ